MQETLQFERIHSSVDPEFWHLLEKKKLHEYKLDNSAKQIWAVYQIGGNQLRAALQLGHESFSELQNLNIFNCVAPGLISNANTIEEFNELKNKKEEILSSGATSIFTAIQTGDWLSNPSLLSTFRLITFADLKAHKFHYWFAFPALVVGETKQDTIKLETKIVSPLSDHYPCLNALQQISTKYTHFRQTVPVEHRGFFIIAQASTGEMTLHLLNQWDKVVASAERVHLGMADPSSLPTNPGWPLRNFLFAAAWTFKRRNFSIICLREIVGKQDFSHSICFDVSLPTVLMGQNIKSVGWEQNTKGEWAPKVANVASMMDPVRLAESSVVLNLELMKWRMFPSLNVEMLNRTKCLLIGAGTLGCHVARNLLAWGIFNITLLDRTRVSFSNPVRQPLYNYSDCLDGGKKKAEAAAESLKLIYPKANAVGISMDIPMPGHPISAAEREKVRKDVEQLEQLIETHDAIFLLTDSRESRWLPSVIGTHKQKIVINAALGFESFVVMRHGQIGQEKMCKSRLGCYFCNDVVAPVNSTKDRTLDQQCTVTRPGVSAIAGALAVELLVALLHHPQKGMAPCELSEGSQTSENSLLSLLPHQIRGSLSTFQNAMLFGVAYEQCTACSQVIMDSYSSEKFGFLEKAFNTPSILEEITGLKELHERTLKQISLEQLNLNSDDDDQEFDII